MARQHPRDEPISPVRGILIGILLSLPLCYIVVAAGYNGYQKLRVIHLPSQENFVSFRTSNGGVVR